jgi:hypothetical protein
MISLLPFLDCVTVVFPQPFVLGQYGGVVLVASQPAPDEFGMLVEQGRIFAALGEFFPR